MDINENIVASFRVGIEKDAVAIASLGKSMAMLGSKAMKGAGRLGRWALFGSKQSLGRKAANVGKGLASAATLTAGIGAGGIAWGAISKKQPIDPDAPSRMGTSYFG